MVIDDTVIFTPMDGGFDVKVYRYGISVVNIWECEKPRQGHWEDPLYEHSH
jgi:hypothetical protein